MHDQRLSNEELLAELRAAMTREGVLLAKVIALLIQVEDRRLHLEVACPSMFDFCRRRLGMSEDEAFRRMTAARLAKRFPQILDAIRMRRVHLSSVILLRHLFTEESVDRLLAEVSGKTKREVEELVARTAPKPDAPSMIRRLPHRQGVPIHGPGTPLVVGPDTNPSRAASDVSSDRTGASPRVLTDEAVDSRPCEETECAPTSPALQILSSTPHPHRMTPLSDERHRVQITISSAVRKKLERAQSLMRHRNVSGDLAIVLERALDLLIMKLEKQKFARTSSSREEGPGSHSRDGGAGARSQENEACGATTAVNVETARNEVTIDVRSSVAPHAAGAPSDRAPPRPSSETARQRSTAPTVSTGNASSNGSVPPNGSATSSRGSRSTSTPTSNRISAEIRRQVILRDGEQCTYISPAGERCDARELLELDHRHPRALGGTNDAANLRLLCRAHNGYAAEQHFGREHVARAIRARRGEHPVDRDHGQPGPDCSSPLARSAGPAASSSLLSRSPSPSTRSPSPSPSPPLASSRASSSRSPSPVMAPWGPVV